MVGVVYGFVVYCCGYVVPDTWGVQFQGYVGLGVIQNYFVEVGRSVDSILHTDSFVTAQRKDPSRSIQLLYLPGGCIFGGKVGSG